MRNLPNYTRHASQRAQQRCIPPLIDKWLDQWGEEEHNHGCIIRYFSKRSIRDMERSYGREPICRLSDKLTAYKIEDSRNGNVITTGYRYKHIRRK